MTKKESTKQADSRVVKAGGDSLATPNILFYVSLALFFIGSFIAETGPDHFLKLSLFAVVCLISFHLAFWVCRKLTNEKALRIVDYMYLGIAFGGVFGVLDVQSSIVKS